VVAWLVAWLVTILPQVDPISQLYVGALFVSDSDWLLPLLPLRPFLLPLRPFLLPLSQVFVGCWI
jgi:hypothetical protein